MPRLSLLIAPYVAGGGAMSHGQPPGCGRSSHDLALVCFVATLALSACSSGAADRAGDGWTATVDTVAGIVHVVNAPPAGGAEPTLVGEEDLRIGTMEGGLPTAFGLIRAIAVLPEGRIAVADAQASEVRVFASDGRHLKTFGGQGQGPGELAGMQGVHVYRGMLRVAEQANGRLSVFDPDTGFVRTYPLQLHSYSFRGPWKAAVDSEGRTLVASAGQYGEGRFWNMVRVYDSAMVQIDSLPYHDYTDEGQADELPGYWRVNLGSNAWSWAPIPFYAQAHEVLAPTGEFWTTTAGSPQLEVARWSPPADTSLVITSLRMGDPVTAAERDSAISALRESLSDRGGSAPAADASSIPATKPTAYGLSLDDQGRVWVRLTEPTRDTTAYDVFTPDGRHAATVRLPFRVDPWIPPVVRGEIVWAVVVDDVEVQYVVRAGLRPAGQSNSTTKE